MKDLSLIIFFVVLSLFAIAFTVRRYQTATALQRRQFLIAAVGALVLAAAIMSLLTFR